MLDAPLPTAVSVIVAVLTSGSLAVLACAAARLRRGQSVLPPVLTAIPRIDPAALTIAALWCGLNLAVTVVNPVQPETPAKVGGVQMLCIVQVLVGAIILAALFAGRRTTPQHLGFTVRDWQQSVSIGVLGYLASLAPVASAVMLTLPWRSEQSQHQLLQLLHDDPSGETLLWIILAAVVIAPAFEELLFRVVLQTGLEQIVSRRFALVAVALGFSAVHRWPDAIPLIPLAFVLGYVYQQRRSFLSIVVIHVLFNATNLWLAWLMLEDSH